MAIITHCPPIPMMFDPNLLSMSTFGFRAEYLGKIGAFLEKKLDSVEFNKYIRTKNTLYQKYSEFMELYERTKIEEGKAKEKTFLKTQWIGYRPRLANKNDERIFDRLIDRAQTSRIDRLNNKVSKTFEVKR